MTIVARTVSPRNRPSGAPAATGPGGGGGGRPGAPPRGVASPPVWGCATWNAGAATRTIARTRSGGPAHASLPRHGRVTPVRRRRAFITISRTPSGAEDPSGRAHLLEEPLAAPLADEPQGEGDHAGGDGETEREDGEADRPAEHAPFGARRGRVQEGRPRHDCDFGRQHEERADRRKGHGDAQGERDRHALRVQDLAAFVGEVVVDPLPAFGDALHEAGRLELLEMLEDGRLA